MEAAQGRMLLVYTNKKCISASEVKAEAILNYQHYF